jgi:quinol-cytochrome oxidoreductase complex cytochrome b subunit
MKTDTWLRSSTSTITRRTRTGIVGIGSFFNLLDFGQMYSYHVLLLPAAVVGIVIVHVLLVRKHGVVPPFRLPRSATASGEHESGPAEAEVSS